MKPSSLCLKIFVFLMAVIGAVPAHLMATDVVIAVVGPWGYVTDPADPNYIYLVAPVAPKAAHEMHIGPGTDYSLWNDAHEGFVSLPDGSYTLNMKVTACAATPPFKGDALYTILPANGSVTVDPTAELGNKHNRFAIHLPKPCYYQEALPGSRMITSATQIVDNTNEKTYTTAMALHYTVDAGFTGGQVNGPTDDNQQLTWPFTFSSGSAPSASIVLAMPNGQPYADCDRDSGFLRYGAQLLEPIPPALQTLPGHQRSKFADTRCLHLHRRVCAATWLRPTAVRLNAADQEETSRGRNRPEGASVLSRSD